MLPYGRELQTVRFRNKVEGWKNSHFTAVYDDGTVDTHPLFETEYGRAFGRALFLRPCCHRCPYASLNRPGDFTLGDLWGLRPDELPEQQQKGVSLLLVNTPHASHVFDQLPLVRQPFPVERAIAGNPRLASPTARPADRPASPAADAVFFALPEIPVRAADSLSTVLACSAAPWARAWALAESWSAPADTWLELWAIWVRVSFSVASMPSRDFLMDAKSPT